MSPPLRRLVEKLRHIYFKYIPIALVFCSTNNNIPIVWPQVVDQTHST